MQNKQFNAFRFGKKPSYYDFILEGKRTIEKYKTAIIFGISICISISTYIFKINGKQMDM